MNTFSKIDRWSASHNSKIIDILRMALGIFLIVKGIQFAADRQTLNSILIESQFDFMSMGLVHYVIFVHIVGGILITLGLATRIAAVFNIPVLLGAVIFVNIKGAYFFANAEFWSAVVTLVLLTGFLFYGSGKMSADEYMRTHDNV